MTIKKPPAPTFFKGYSFGGSYWVGCLPRNPFEEEKGFTLHCMEMSCEKPSQVAIRIFDKFSLRHRATVKALGSLESGFSLPLSLNSRMGEDSPALEPSSSPNPHLPMLGLGCWARGVLPPRHLARQLTSSRSATSLHLSAHYLLRSVPLKQRLVHT